MSIFFEAIREGVEEGLAESLPSMIDRIIANFLSRGAAIRQPFVWKAGGVKYKIHVEEAPHA